MAAVEWFRNLGTRVGIYGVEGAETKLRSMGVQFDSLQNMLEGTRTMFLFMSFGLLAAGGLIKRFGDSLKQVMDNVVNSFEQVDYQATVTGTILGSTSKEIGGIREEMLQLGRDTEWTATQAGAAMQRLAMAGFSVHETMGAANATLQLATIGLTDVTTAADLSVGIFRGFQYSAENATEASQTMSAIVSNLAFAATHSATMIDQLGESLKFVAAAAAMVGWELEEVTAGLMIAADNMVRAGIAGRGLRMSIINLAKAAGIQEGSITGLEEMLSKYNITITDSDKNLLGLADIVDELNLKFKDLASAERVLALKTMFGTRATTMWTALMQEGGDTIRYNTLAMKAAAAKEALYIEYGIHATDMLKTWRQQVGDQTADVTKLTGRLVEMGFTTEVISDIIDVITSDFEGVEEAIEEAGIASEITRERLNTLHGTILLLESSVDALWASIGQELAPILMEWNRLMKSLADIISKLPKEALIIIGMFILLGSTLLPLIGNVTMLIGTIMMLTAAMAALVKMQGDEITATNIMIMSKGMLVTALHNVTVAVWKLTVAFAKLMLKLGAFIFTILIIQHVFERFGKAAGIIVTLMLSLGWAVFFAQKKFKLFNFSLGWSTKGTWKAVIAKLAHIKVTYAQALAQGKLNAIMAMSPLFIMVAAIYLVTQGLWQLGLVIGWLAIVWMILNYAMAASPITYIVLAFAMLVMAILTLLGVSGELEKWFSGKHSFNTVVSSATSGSDTMRASLGGVEESMTGITKAGHHPDMFRRKPGMPIAGAASMNQSKKTTFYRPQSTVKIDKLEMKTAISPGELRRITSQAANEALGKWSDQFELEAGF